LVAAAKWLKKATVRVRWSTILIGSVMLSGSAAREHNPALDLFNWVVGVLVTISSEGRRVGELLGALEEYRAARQRLLEVLGPRPSNRDPLAEFAEHFVAALTGGWVAVSPVQAGWDVQLADGARSR
jgi:hypothetical protein